MRIFVTGGAGLIGRAVAASLAARGHEVAAMARRDPGPAPPGVDWVEGDVRTPLLGAEAIAARGVDVVVHCAAVTGFNLAPEAYQAVNVGGTANALAFAAAAGASLLHVSTAYVSGDRDGVITESERDCGQAFTNGYEASKAAAEALVEAAGGAIARPSIVTGAWADGAIGSFTGVYKLFGLIGSGRIGAFSAAPGATLDLVPIDHVVAGLVDIAERMPAAAGRAHHLVSGAPMPVETMHRIAVGHPGLRVARMATGGEIPAEMLGPILRLYAGYLTRAPRFVAENLQRLSGRVCPPVDAAYVGRLIDYAIGAGVLGATGG